MADILPFRPKKKPIQEIATEPTTQERLDDYSLRLMKMIGLALQSNDLLDMEKVTEAQMPRMMLIHESILAYLYAERFIYHPLQDFAKETFPGPGGPNAA
jgi:hypothetical protein